MGDVKTASDAFASKIHPSLKAAVAAAAPTDEVNLLVYAKPGTDLNPYMDKLLVQKYVMPNGTQANVGVARAGAVEKIASLQAVAAVQELKSTAHPPQLQDGPAPRLNTDIDALRARLADLKAGGLKATVTRPAADKAGIADWFDVLDVHKSKMAWDMGYTGDGVKVMVNDTGTDFAHPDLQGTVARITDPASPYYGWPEMFDSFSLLNLAYDYFLGTDYVASGVGIFGLAPDYADTSTTRSGAEVVPCGCSAGTVSAIFKPIGSTDPAGHVYTFLPTSLSGVYHFGSHPDTQLAALLGERAAVLVVDEQTAGVYDTVYVDLDADYNFTNNKKAVLGDEYVYMDLDGDSYPDLSGGIIYYIADGMNPPPTADWMWGIGADVAGPGDLVAFAINDPREGGGDHGTLCASGVAGQGVIDGGSPAFKPVGDGTPGTGMVQGGGKNVQLTHNGNGYTTAQAFTEGLLFAAMGYDGFPDTEDDIQLVSDSWGSSGTVNDGWDSESRTFDLIQRAFPGLLEMNSTGNGGAGYGTNNSPGANMSASIGASTLYDSDGYSFDSIVAMDQLLYNDSMSFSDRGPSAQGENGVSALAEGAWGAGDTPLNLVLDGWNAWENWGGTSRSTPVAAGNLALAYQAFKDKNGRFPTNVEGRAILMSGSDTAYNDGFTEGAGVVNAARSAGIAGGQGGVYVIPDSVTFGDFRGTKYDAFTSIMHPGQTATQEFTVHNPSDSDVTLNISDDQLVRIAQKEIDFTTVNQSLESALFRMPDYLIDVEQYIPAGTEMMEIKLVFPFSEFDPDGNYSANSSWRVVPTDWTDINGNGMLYMDKNGNGAINCPSVGGVPKWGDPACEIEGGEYMRFGYGYDRGTSMQQRVKMPLARMHDGIFVGLSHRSRSATVPITNLKIQLNFYKRADFPWLTTDPSVTVPAGGSATFNATMAVSALANVGLYEATIRLDDGQNWTNIPVVANVAAFSTDFLFGGPPETMTPYDNGQVYGYFDWTARAESGDWRFYFVDVPDSTPAGTKLLVDNRWTGANTDIDTLIMGPTQDCFSNGVGCEWPFEIFPGWEDVYGPYSLSWKGGSARLNPSAGVWTYNTSTGGPREIVAAPAEPGLNLVALHNVMFDGAEPQERFQGQVGTITGTPDMVDLFVGTATSGSIPVSVKSSLPLAGLEADAYGMGVPETQTLPQHQDDPDDPSTAFYTFPIAINHGARLDVSTAAATGDIDLFLLYDFNGDGNFNWNTERVASSTTSTANESISLTFPPDGNYLAAVHGWGVDPGADFTIRINAIQGYDLSRSAVPAARFQPNQPINFNLDWTLPAPLVSGEAAEGLLLAGPPGAPGAVEIPVRLHNVTTSTVKVTVPDVADATLQQWAPNTNMGNNPDLYAGFADSLRAVLKFDTSGINPMYPVLSAKMHVYVNGYGSTGQPHTLGAYPVTTPWSVNTVTWLTPWTTAGGDFMTPAISSVPISSADVGTWLTLDVTSAAAQWVANPSMNNGVELRATNGLAAAQFRFSARNAWYPAEKPWMEIEYAVP